MTLRYVLLVLALFAPALAGQQKPAVSLDAAHVAWDNGDYVTALNGYLTLVQRPASQDVLDAIALKTGELYETREITDDGLAPRFDPTGTLIAYEAGTGIRRVTRIVDATNTFKSVTQLPGYGAVFAPSSGKVAYFRARQPEAFTRTVTELERLSPQPPNSAYQQQLLAWLLSNAPDIVVRDLASGREVEIKAEGLLKSTLAYSADGRALYFVGARETDDTRHDIYSVSESVPQPLSLTEASRGFKTGLTVDPRGTYLVYVVPAQNPFRRPAPPSPAGPPSPTGAGAPAAVPAPPPSFAVHDLKTGVSKVIAGSVPTVSADGSTLAYVARASDENSVMIGSLGGTATAVKQTQRRLDAPALSADGRRVAFQMMPNDDWEIYLIDRDGANEKRVTREIQHDVLPRFLTSDRLLASMGEPRHRRSYLYDLNAMTRTRVFHNNTVRTVAPEYAWVVGPDPSRVLIGAERDGDTVSVARGIYLVSLDKTISKGQLQARLEANLQSELDLRERGQRMYRPVADAVRRVVADVSAARIFSYEKALFDFDSKHISRPGNKLASEYLHRTYASFGYQPRYQWFAPRNAAGGQTANVVATLPGTENPELVYVVSSHYDSVVAGPGADDDTSGTAALLEAARVLANHPMPATIVFASFTGEEAGLLGSREFVRLAHVDKLRIAGALNNDMIGWANDHRLDNTIRYSNPGIRDVQHAGAAQFSKLITYDALYYKSTDAAAFYEGWGDIVGGIGSYPILGSPYYHQATDTLEIINHDLIAETCKTTVASIMLLASSPSRITGLKAGPSAGGTAELTWNPSPEKSVRSYIVTYGSPSKPFEHRVIVTEPKVTLRSVPPGSVVAVKAVNAKGLEGWDWARTTIAVPQ